MPQGGAALPVFVERTKVLFHGMPLSLLLEGKMALGRRKHDYMLITYLTEHKCSAKEVFLRAWNKATGRAYDLVPHTHHAKWVKYHGEELPPYVKRFLENETCSRVSRWPSLSR